MRAAFSMFAALAAPMGQFWTIRLPDGRRVLIEADARTDRYHPMIGFGVVRATLEP
jgi:hypothetical protein